MPMPELTKKKRAPKPPPLKQFWDTPAQKVSAKKFADKYGLNWNSPAIQLSLRAQQRQLQKLKHPTENKPIPPSFKKTIEDVEKADHIIRPEEIQGRSNFHKSLRLILSLGLPTDDKEGSLPEPTGYDSHLGTRWDTPKDIENRQRINFVIVKGEQIRLPIFDSDEDWMEFFLGDPETGGSLLRPKKSKDIIKLRQMGKLGQLYDIQRELSQFLDDNPLSKFEVWRGAGKTVVAIGKLLRKMCDNPNECFFFQSETDDKTIQRIRAIKREFQTNQKIIAFYGYLPADSESTGEKIFTLGKKYKGKWSEAVIELKRDYAGIEPTMMGLSWQTGRGVGYHYTGGVLDDPWSVKNQTTEGHYKRFWDWWGEFFGGLEGADFIWVLCTKKGLDDIYLEMDERKLFATFRRKLVIEWPTQVRYIEKNGAYVGVDLLNSPRIKYVEDDCFGKYTIEQCLLIRKRITATIFEREYQNNPRPLKGKLFEWDNLRKCSLNSPDPFARKPFKEDNQITGLFIYDPAFGLSHRASFNALLAMGIHTGRIYLLQAWVGHWTKAERIKNFNEARTLFPRYPFYCEDVMHQLNIIKDLTDTTGIFLRSFDPRNRGTKYKDLFKGEKDAAKKAKVYDGMESPIEDRRLYYMPKMDHLDEFEEEYKNFPGGLRYDMLDACAMGIMILEGKQTKQKALSSDFFKRDNMIPNGIKNGSFGQQYGSGNIGRRL